MCLLSCCTELSGAFLCFMPYISPVEGMVTTKKQLAVSIVNIFMTMYELVKRGTFKNEDTKV